MKTGRIAQGISVDISTLCLYIPLGISNVYTIIRTTEEVDKSIGTGASQ